MAKTTRLGGPSIPPTALEILRSRPTLGGAPSDGNSSSESSETASDSIEQTLESDQLIVSDVVNHSQPEVQSADAHSVAGNRPKKRPVRRRKTDPVIDEFDEFN